MDLFSHIKIIDLTKVFSGPLATRHFADFGANVIKIEPSSGDDSRYFPPLVGNWSGYFEVLNRGKQSLVLNLKEKNDLQKFYQLCADADVVVENFSPATKKHLHIDYNTIKKINPKIIYASISGISQNIERKYYDVIAQAESGLISLNGGKTDMKNATSVIDAFSGIKLAFAISSALYSREISGQGCQIDVSMKGSAFDLLEQNLIAASITHKNPPKVGNHDSAIAPFGVFNTKDKSIVLAIGNESQWQIFASFLKKQNPKISLNIFSSNNLRLLNFQKLNKIITSVFEKINSADLQTNLQSIGIPCAEVKTMTEVLSDPENYQEKLLQKITHPIAGEIVVPTGGIKFSNFTTPDYKFAPSLNPPIVFLPYSRSYQDQVVNLLNLCFPGRKITPDTFNWKHFDKFFNQKSLAYIALKENTLCCFVCFTPLKINNPSLQLFYSCAVQATHPSFRRMGLVTKLTQLIEKELGAYSNYLGFSNESGLNIDRYSQKINYQIVGQLLRRYVLSLPTSSNLSFSPIDTIQNVEWPNFSFHIDKSADYLEWRYERNPKNKYKYYAIHQNQNLVGYLVCNISTYRIEVVDIIFDQKTISISKIISAFSDFAFKLNKPLTTYTYLPGILWHQAFPLLSFSKKLQVYLTVKSKETSFYDPNRWLIQAGDIQ